MPEWLTFLLADTSALQLVFWIIAIGALITVIVKLWPALTQLVTIVNSVTGLPTFMASTGETLAEHGDMLKSQDTAIKSIYHETHHNNGSSIKDSQVRTETLVNQIFDITATLATKDAELEAAIEENTQRPKE